MLLGCFPPSSLVPTHSRLRDSRGGKVWRGAAFAGPTGSPQPTLRLFATSSCLLPSLPRPPVHLITEASSCAARASLRLSPPDLRAPAARAVARLALLHLAVSVCSRRTSKWGLRCGRGVSLLFGFVVYFISFFFSERGEAVVHTRPGRKMSNVRVSNGSPSLERMDARQAEHPKPSACRNLFGPVNHEELTRDLEKHCRDMEEASQRKWNFDFQNHKPLEGRYEWQEVERGSLPEFYYRPPRPPKSACKVPAQESLDVSGSRQAVPSIGSQANSEDRHLVDQMPDSSDSPAGLAEQCPGMRKRPAAEDSSSQNKRANRTEENVSDGSPNAGTVEQTPKKPGLRRQT